MRGEWQASIHVILSQLAIIRMHAIVQGLKLTGQPEIDTDDQITEHGCPLDD